VNAYKGKAGMVYLQVNCVTHIRGAILYSTLPFLSFFLRGNATMGNAQGSSKSFFRYSSFCDISHCSWMTF